MSLPDPSATTEEKPMPALRAKSSSAMAIAPDCEMSDRRPGSALTAP